MSLGPDGTRDGVVRTSGHLLCLDSIPDPVPSYGPPDLLGSPVRNNKWNSRTRRGPVRPSVISGSVGSRDPNGKPLLPRKVDLKRLCPKLASPPPPISVLATPLLLALLLLRLLSPSMLARGVVVGGGVVGGGGVGGGVVGGGGGSMSGRALGGPRSWMLFLSL